MRTGSVSPALFRKSFFSPVPCFLLVFLLEEWHPLLLLLRKGARFGSALLCHSLALSLTVLPLGKRGHVSLHSQALSVGSLGSGRCLCRRDQHIRWTESRPHQSWARLRREAWNSACRFFSECDLQSFQKKEWGITSLHLPNSHARTAKEVFTQM